MSRKRFGRQKRKHYKRFKEYTHHGYLGEIFMKDTYLFAPRHKRKDYNFRPDALVTYMVTWNAPSPARMGVISVL